MAVLSGRDYPALSRRFIDLDITEAVLGQVDKWTELLAIIERYDVAAEEVTFNGDHIPDMKVFSLCGVSITVSDALDYVKAMSDLVLKC